MPGAVAGDTLGADSAGDFRTVDGVLTSLRVADAPQARQRVAIAEVRERPGLASLLLPLEPELRARGLID